jgi:hypothetical protein
MNLRNGKGRANEMKEVVRNELNPWRKNPKFHHRTHNSQPPVPVLSQSNPIHNPQANLPKIHSDSILPPSPWSSEQSLSFGISHEKPVQFYLLSNETERGNEKK